jgi:hypothetical protein
MAYLVGQVHLRFAQQGWPLPDRRTVKARVDEIERRFAARKRQDAAAIKATTPVPASTRLHDRLRSFRLITRSWISLSSMRKRALRSGGHG